MLTAVEIFEEYAKCLDSPIYAIESYLQTFDKTQEGFVPFKLFVRQKEIVRAYEKHRFNLVTKPRQAGISTTTQAYCSIKIGFADPKNPETIIVIANKLTLAKKFLKGIKDYVNQLPRWVWGNEYYGSEEKNKKSIFIKDSQIEVELPNGSKIIAVATSEDALRGYTPTFLIFDEAAFIDRGADLYAAAVTSLGCLTKDSLILTENGLVELDELVTEKDKLGFTDLETPHMVCNKDGILTPATQTFVSEYGETFKIKTKLGIELEGSWKHPLLINRNGEEVWVRMNELVVGDKPIINYGQNYFGQDSKFDFSFDRVNYNQKNINIPLNLSDNLDFCYLLGLFVSEGNFTSRGITITNVDEQITNFLINDVAKLGNGFKKVDDRHYMFHSTELVEWFDKFGLKKHNARDKEIPLSILKMPKEVIVNFLQGMFDGDGMSTIKDIKYSSTSKKLIKTLQTLLLNFGVISHIKKEIQKTSESSIISNKDHICTIYNLKIYSDHAIKFYDEIGFRLDRKQKNKQYLIGKKLNSRFIDVSQKTILNILNKNGLTKYKFRFLERFWSSKYERLSYESLNRLMIEIPNDIDLLRLSEQIKNNEKYYIDEIIEITNGVDYTYDLHVPETNSFISNGIVSHNTGGRAILISTPNGYDPLYYKTYEQALRKDNTYNVIELKWYEDPRYNKDLSWLKGDEVIKEFEFTLDSYKKKVKEGYKPTSTWYSDMCKNMNNDKKKIAQELDVSFLGSGGNVIDDEFIEFHEKNNVTEPKYIDKSYYDGNSGLIWVWSEPIEGHEYIMAADVARGDGADYSCFQIIDFTTMEQVVEYQGKIPPDNFAEVLTIYGLKYDAFLIVDNIGVGNTTTTKLVELKYPNLYYEEKTKDNKVAGFNINGCRLQLISNLEIAIRTNSIKINSIRLIHEMKTFIYKNGRPDHMEGYHDDCLKKGTLIKTIEGYKPIEDIKVGDLVLTHLGRYKEVEACLEKPFNGEWYDFKFQGMLNLGLSYNHPLYSAPNTWKDVNSDDYNKREWVLPNEWDKNKNGSIRKQTNRSKRQVSIKENLPENNNTVLNYNDFRTKHPNELNAGLNKIILDNNFAKFLGLFLADGYAPTIEKEYDGNKYYTMSIAFHVKDESLCIEMSEYLKSININSHRSKVKGNGFALIFSSKFLSGILSHCYNNNREKILPYYAYNLGQDLNLVLDYWIKGDGWIDNKHGYDFIAASTSKQLALSMMDIAWSCGKYATISLHTRHRYDVKTKDQYWVNIRNEFKNGDRLKLLSNFEYGNKTVKINKTIYNGMVYNLQVKDDESFIADGIVVHNCLLSLGMALWILESSFKSLKKAKEQTKAILSSWIVGGTDSSTSTITTIDPISNKKTTRINPNHSAYRNVQDPNGEYMWLFSGMR